MLFYFRVTFPFIYMQWSIFKCPVILTTYGIRDCIKSELHMSISVCIIAQDTTQFLKIIFTIILCTHENNMSIFPDLNPLKSIHVCQNNILYSGEFFWRALYLTIWRKKHLASFNFADLAHDPLTQYT